LEEFSTRKVVKSCENNLETCFVPKREKDWNKLKQRRKMEKKTGKTSNKDSVAKR
jgi:hypothetical protein